MYVVFHDSTDVADQCVFEHDCIECRRSNRFGVGQNLYIYKQSTVDVDNDWERVAADWYGEVNDINSDNIEPFKFSSSTGYYTQVVWAESDKVGSGVISYKQHTITP